MMFRYLLSAGIIVAFSTPAIAGDYYIWFSLGGGGCKVVTNGPSDTKSYKVLGQYDSENAARLALAQKTECRTDLKEQPH